MKLSVWAGRALSAMTASDMPCWAFDKGNSSVIIQVGERCSLRSVGIGK